MPISTRHARTLSPPQSLAGHSNAPTASQAKLNVVNRLAIEGKCKKGQDGANIRMYLKISLPVDSISPGGIVPLFPEENLKFLDSQVHPLDKNSAPYNFSSDACPLLHRAARALGLPARLSQSYLSLFDSSSPSTSSASSTAWLEDRYTGHVGVSGYHISYILPKDIPPRDSDNYSRRGTNTMLFMAAIDLWVPFLTQPPHAPYLLSIPVPRCLSNNIRLSIFPPGPTAMTSSYASLSSAGEDDSGPWELTSDPYVTRTASSRRSRANSYSSFADDESSDSSASAGFAEGCGIQGTFQSTDRVRIRWATPSKVGQTFETGDGRRRVGVREVKGEISCEVLGKGKAPERAAEGILMKLEYKAACKGVWFPGVATLLGMDVSLDAGDHEVVWAPGEPQRWTVTGEKGFTGFAVAGLPQVLSGTQTPPIYVLPSTPNGVPTANGAISRQDSSSSTHSASLLRTPLPNHNVADYSFEGTPLSTPTGTISSLASLPASTPDRRLSRSRSMSNPFLEPDPEEEPELEIRPPQAPLTVHINMNELLPPNRDPFKFTISGTVLVVPRQGPPTPESRKSSPRQRISSDTDSVEPTPVPMFRILYKDREINTTTVSNSAPRFALEVLSSASGDRSSHGHRTIIQRGDQLKCGTDRPRLTLRPPPPTPRPPVRTPNGAGSRDASVTSEDTPQSRSRVPSSLRAYLEEPSRVRHTSMSMMSTARPLPRRDGELMIPYVTATVMPLMTSDKVADGLTYAVHLSLPAPSDSGSEWLQFGLEKPEASEVEGWEAPNIDIASASVEGIPVRILENLSAESASIKDLTQSLEGVGRRKWLTWIQVHVGELGGGRVDITYIARPKKQKDTEQKNEEKNKEKAEKRSKNSEKKGKQRAKDTLPTDILLPCFTLPVGQLDVSIKVQPNYVLSELQTNLVQQESSLTACKLVQLALKEVQKSQLRVRISPLRTLKDSVVPLAALWRLLLISAVVVPLIFISFLAYELRSRNAELQQLRSSLTDLSAGIDAGQFDAIPETVTVTATTIATVPQQWWYTADSVPTPLAEHISVDASEDFSVEELALQPLPTIVATPAMPHSTPPAHQSSTEQQALLPVHHLPFPWPLRLDIPDFTKLDIAQTARVSAEAVVKGLEVAWKIFQKVMYYPLDPP